MNLAELFAITPNGHAELLQRAAHIQQHLPPASPGSLVALAFDSDREAFVASLLATWMQGHGAAVVENTLRERILPVLEHESVVMLLHDTDSGRTLQVPRLLATEHPQSRAESNSQVLPALAAQPLLCVHVQTEDGRQQWCSWLAHELADAIDAVADSVPVADSIAVAHSDAVADSIAVADSLDSKDLASLPTAKQQSPGLLRSLFADTLVPLRRGDKASATDTTGAEFDIPGAISVASPYRLHIDELQAKPGITDAEVVGAPDGRELIALAGPGATKLLSQLPHARSFDPIPRDQNGQPQVAELFLAFGLGRTGQPVQRQLEWLPVPSAEAGAEVTLRTTVPSNYLFYEGHFATYPVLAGGVQLHELVLPCLHILCGSLPELEQLDGIKFLARIAPGDTIDVELQRSDDPRKVTFEIKKDAVRCTTGRLAFACELPALRLPGSAE